MGSSSMIRSRTTLEFENVRSRRRRDPAQPDIEIHGAVDLSLEDLAAYERESPESQPVCDLSAVIAEVVDPG